jgi:hypothetical protein
MFARCKITRSTGFQHGMILKLCSGPNIRHAAMQLSAPPVVFVADAAVAMGRPTVDGLSFTASQLDNPSARK